MNLIYIRAAIEQATGQRLPLRTVLRLLVEEGIVTPDEASQPGLIFRGYSEYYRTDDAAVFIQPPEGEPNHGKKEIE